MPKQACGTRSLDLRRERFHLWVPRAQQPFYVLSPNLVVMSRLEVCVPDEGHVRIVCRKALYELWQKILVEQVLHESEEAAASLRSRSAAKAKLARMSSRVRSGSR